MAPDESDKLDQKHSSACRSFDEQLEAYLDSEERTLVLRHAAECAGCGGVLKDLQMIRAAARDLPLETPSPRVWKNVRAALVQEGLVRGLESNWIGWLRAPGIPLRFASATSVAAVAVMGAVFIFGPRLNRKPAGAGSQAAISISPSTANYTAEQLSLARTVDEMEQAFKQRETSMPPVIKSTYEKGLASLDTSIRQTLDSVHRNPQDELARQYLMDAYAQKANILTSALEYDSN